MVTQISPQKLIDNAEHKLSTAFKRVDLIALNNQRKVLHAFRQHRLSEEFFAERTGYGLNDAARGIIDSIFATIFATEAAAVRLQLVSGTHALACALLGNLKPKD